MDFVEQELICKLIMEPQLLIRHFSVKMDHEPTLYSRVVQMEQQEHGIGHVMDQV